MSSRYLLSAVIPVGNLKARLTNINKLVRMAEPAYDWLQLIFVFAGESRSDDHLSFSHIYESHIEQGQIKAAISPDHSPGAGRNMGLELSSSTFIVFWDDDDEPILEKLQERLQEMNSNTVCVFQFIRAEILESKSRMTMSNTSSITELIVDPGLWRIIFPRDVIRNYRFTHVRIGEDLLFLLDVLEAKLELVFSPTPIYIYQVGQNSITSHYSFEDIHPAIRTLDTKSKGTLQSSFLRGIVWWSLIFSYVKRKGFDSYVTGFFKREIRTTRFYSRMLFLPSFVILKLSLRFK